MQQSAFFTGSYGAAQGKDSFMGKVELWCWKSKNDTTEPRAVPGES